MAMIRRTRGEGRGEGGRWKTAEGVEGGEARRGSETLLLHLEWLQRERKKKHREHDCGVSGDDGARTMMVMGKLLALRQVTFYLGSYSTS